MLELETQFYEQTKLISKAELLVSAFLNNTEFTREDLAIILNDKTRAGQIKQAHSKPETETKEVVYYEEEKPVEKKIKTPKEKKSLTKKERVDTKNETFMLFKQGKTIPEISKLRNMTNSTIEGHLAYYVAIGEVDISGLLSDKRMGEIIVAAKQLDTFLLNPIKQLLGAEYSYGEIRLALASHLSKDN